MKASNIEIGKWYSIKDNPYYFKPLKVLTPKEGGNPHNRIVVKGLFSTSRHDSFGLIRYFKPSDIKELN